MAFRRLRGAAAPVVLAVSLLGAGCAQGSGLHARAGQTPTAEVLAATEEREAPVGAPSTTAAPAALADPAPDALADPAPPDVAPPTGDDHDHREPAPADPEPAAAPTPVPAPAPAPAAAGQDALVAATLARISYPWQDVLRGWDVRFLPARAGVRGLTFPGDRRIEVYVRATDTPATLARVLAHELGHALDIERNDARDRARWREVRGVAPTVPWWPNDAASDFATLAGDFAEAFAVWQTGTTSQSTVAGQPTDDELAVLAALVA